MSEHDDPVAYWSQQYWDTVAEHDKELLAFRKELSNKYEPVFKQIMSNIHDAKMSDRSNENSNTQTP